MQGHPSLSRHQASWWPLTKSRHYPQRKCESRGCRTWPVARGVLRSAIIVEPPPSQIDGYLSTLILPTLDNYKDNYYVLIVPCIFSHSDSFKDSCFLWEWFVLSRDFFYTQINGFYAVYVGVNFIIIYIFYYKLLR